MKKIISFSLYGTDVKYTEGAICNVELSNIIYPEWICRFYYGKSVPEQIISKLKKYKNVELIQMEENNEFSYASWRFLAIDDSDVEIMLSRDADSRLSFREKKLVDLFLNSEYMFQDIRDHTLHNGIMAGMFGIKKGCLKSTIKELLISNNFGLYYGADQEFLNKTIAPLVKDKTLSHHSNYNPEIGKCSEDFIIQINDIQSIYAKPIHNHFIGEIFPGDNYGKPCNYIFY